MKLGFIPSRYQNCILYHKVSQSKIHDVAQSKKLGGTLQNYLARLGG